MEDVQNYLKERIVHDLGGKMAQSKYGKIKKFSAKYVNITLFEYKIDKQNCISVGFCSDREDVHILLFFSPLSTIKKNNTAVKNQSRAPLVFGHKRIKLINPIVFTVKKDQKKALRLHPDHGYFINGTLLKCDLRHAAFSVILKNTLKAI